MIPEEHSGGGSTGQTNPTSASTGQRPPRRGPRRSRFRGRRGGRRQDDRRRPAPSTEAEPDAPRDEIPTEAAPAMDSEAAENDVPSSESSQMTVREELEDAEVVPPPSPARSPQPPPQQYARPDRNRSREHGTPVQKAIQDVEEIVGDLKETLEQMEEVLEILEQAEREKTADEREIEQLRRSLKNLHRGQEGSFRSAQGQRGSFPRRSPPARESASPEPAREPEPEMPPPETGEGSDPPQPS